MKHDNYFEIDAANTFELGIQKGKLFGQFLRKTLKAEKRKPAWQDYLGRSKAYLHATLSVFPHLVDELRGYARAAEVAFKDLWALTVLDEFTAKKQERCTTVVTNNGFLVAHNEDWSVDAADSLCVLRRTVGSVTTFELFYLNSLGGNAMSINSDGVTQTINTLDHVDHQEGIPKDVIARWMSDTSNPDFECKRFGTLKRASGYHHVLVNSLGSVWSIESSATEYSILQPTIPFVHTNHFLDPRFSALEGSKGKDSTYRRLKHATDIASRTMSFEEARTLLGDSSHGKRHSVFNRRTIGRMILDVNHMRAFVWLQRERKKGWLTYDMNFE